MKLKVRPEEWNIAELIFKVNKSVERKLSRKDSKTWESGAKMYFQQELKTTVVSLKDRTSTIDEMVKSFLGLTSGKYLSASKIESGYYEQWASKPLKLHSFELVNNKLYATAVGRDLGEGAECKIKLSESRDGHLLAKRVFFESATPDSESHNFTTVHEKLAKVFKLLNREYHAYAVTEPRKPTDDLLESQYALIKFNRQKPKQYSCKIRSFIPYCEAVDLKDFMCAHQRPLDRLDEQSVALLAYKIVNCIYNSAEVFGLVHCDIKPENILVRTQKKAHEIIVEELELYLIDFNDSILLDGSDDKEHVWLGTDGYTAPEAIDKRVHKTTDSFSVGVMIERAFKYLEPSKHISELIAGLKDENPKTRFSLLHAQSVLEHEVKKRAACSKLK